jgi:hypothetical protein
MVSQRVARHHQVWSKRGRSTMSRLVIQTDGYRLEWWRARTCPKCPILVWIVAWPMQILWSGGGTPRECRQWLAREKAKIAAVVQAQSASLSVGGCGSRDLVD